MPLMRGFFSYPFSVVAVDVGGTKIAGAIVRYDDPDARPRVEGATSVPSEPERGGDAVLASMTHVVAQLMEAAPTPLAGIGCATAGVVSPRTGDIAYANGIMPGWTGQPVARHLAKRFGVQATNMSDVHAHALGEARFGAATDLESCLLVGIGTGLGGAYILKGNVIRGFNGVAGHLGHSLHHQAGNLECACGAHGHAESITSGTALVQRYQQVRPGDPIDRTCMGDEVARRAYAGEQRACETLSFCGEALGQAIGSWCNILDPQAVVLSGTVVNAGPLWREAIDRGFAQQALEPLKSTPIVEGQLGSAAPLVGAAENLLDALALSFDPVALAGE
ncbi:ROK family protein [Eggerthellaceae bacterium zg-1084]|uniref:ROK family protein n=1 Tax=Berryella wangjianweii TaxID=2734634 RepID=A0A6M8J328_9ACTN|nr:ROK family protein [Berryella wangjianweii]NPD31482.1 ROK family protein [Berryella wangjianweii]NPD33018.1 ROK family protein [Eggerthellaceae bacterium zg-997]QKF07894.1 ROK family protein [Berryella wangjianweii]